MQNTDNEIYFNFSYQALKLLGDGLYSNPWTAISELIANGIDANANKIYLYINMLNKQSSTIEIFDNGHGMNYNDLVSKYALIGKNKRIDKDIDDIQKETVMGRKGIGKLAALYLTPKYYLVSKTIDETSAWCFDMDNVQDDETPSIKRIREVSIESKKQWQTCKTGTLIKLVNVDFRNIGEQTVAGLKAHIADYYAFGEKNIDIFVAIKQDHVKEIVFELAEKQIAFKNFYAFFNNIDTSINKKLSSEILLKTSFPEKMPDTKKVKEATKDVYYKKCPTKILNNVFETSGEQRFCLENGELSETIHKYELKGWIGVHSTIAKSEARLNDKIFLKNKAYQPNRLRLYVRNKLAVENFMQYLHNTQALGKYIEGEIHFDVLDANDLPDIATADRQDYKEENDRIQKLIEILKPIIGALTRSRIAIGHQIREEEEDYRKTKENEQAQETEDAKEDARKAHDAKDKAEAHSRKVEEELEKEKKQSIFQRSIIGREKEQIMSLQHQIKHSASRIKKNVHNLYKKMIKSNDLFISDDVIKRLSTISIESENIESIAKYVTNANFNLKATEINEDIVRFIYEYINEIYLYFDTKHPKINLLNKDNIDHKINFRPLEITSIVDNFISNAYNAEAHNVTFSFSKNNSKLVISIFDDGKGILDDNMSKIFDFGFSTTSTGSGIGLYVIKKGVENLKGEISVVSHEKRGTTFTITI